MKNLSLQSNVVHNKKKSHLLIIYTYRCGGRILVQWHGSNLQEHERTLHQTQEKHGLSGTGNKQ